MDHDNPIDQYQFEARLLRDGIERVQKIREGKADPAELSQALRVLAVQADDLAHAAEAFANDIDRQGARARRSDAELLATLERIAQIGGNVDVRA
jgi:hypothetical protein